MSSVVLIPWAATDWTARGRLSAQTELPLNDDGRAQAETWGRQLTDRKLAWVFSSAELTSKETATAIARSGGMRLKTIGGLEEVDFGLWEGLTEDALKARFPKVYKRWKEDPTAVCPPEGEDLLRASERIRTSLKKVARKAGDAPVAVVLGPVACALARCELESRGLEEMHKLLTDQPVWYDAAIAAPARSAKSME